MRLEENPLLPTESGALTFTLSRLFRSIAQKVNGLADGRLVARDLTSTAAPTTGMYAKGDIVWNSNPSELGAAASKYVVIGWINITAGTPGTFVALRCLTGN